MPQVMNCPHCTKKLGVPDNAAGKQVRCPSCQQVFTVPSFQSAAPPPAAVPAPIPPPLPVPKESVTAEPPAPAKPRRSPEPPDDDDYEEERPRRRPAPRDAAPMKFKLTVKADPDRKLKGVFEATLNDEGLKVKQGKKHNYLVPIGSRAIYDGKNIIVLEIDEREVEFKVMQFGAYQHRLARDVVAYLKGKKERLNPKRYKLEWYLLAPAVLPFGIPILTLGGALPCAIGFGTAGGCVVIAQQDKWPVPLRLGLILGLTVVAYIVTFLLVFLIIQAQRGR
jgi:hypothetical protein